MLGLLGKKKGMTQVFGDSGELIPVTVVEVGPCVVVDRKTKERDGYEALQLGFQEKKASRTSKPQRIRYEKCGTTCYQHLREFRANEIPALTSGHVLTAAAFEAGDIVNVRGVSKGRGFQGVIKRHGKAGGPQTHGSGFHRSPGSIGMCSDPSRVFKNTALPGHMGVDNVLIKNLEVIAVRPEDNVILIRGAVPGSREGVLEIYHPDANAFSGRDAFKIAADKNVESKDNTETADKATETTASAENVEAEGSKE